MLHSLHTAIAALLHDRGKIPPAEVDVRFELPSKQWADSLVRPTINLFLFEMEEKLEMRNAAASVARANGRAVTRSAPRRFDLRYLACAFSSVTEDEHTLLWRALATLLKHPQLPADLLPAEIRAMDIALQAKVGRAEGDPRSLDLWGALDLPPRPALFYTVTAPLDLDLESKAPLVLSRTLRTTRPEPGGDRAARGVDPERITSRAGGEEAYAPLNGVAVAGTLVPGLLVTGVVRDAAGAPVPGLTVGVVGHAPTSTTDGRGEFALPRVPTGFATLEVRRGKTLLTTVAIEVPSEIYDIALG